MFTGIVTARGSVTAVYAGADGLKLTIAAPYDDLEPGESIAVNGACLTVVETDGTVFSVEAIATTRDRTTLQDLRVGSEVNLERALAVGDRLGGHFVQGHVDGVAEVVGVTPRDDAVLVDLKVPEDVLPVTIPHGSITVDGVSFTVNALPAPGVVQVSVIPYTREHTTLGGVKVGDRLHVEGDMLGKFVHHLMENRGTWHSER
ncbi:MAG: riboflavin synthase [Gemmatimonadetes bacterium]|nr:riboflavin synthase [Gemmatimonadota bacterium]